MPHLHKGSYRTHFYQSSSHGEKGGSSSRGRQVRPFLGSLGQGSSGGREPGQVLQVQELELRMAQAWAGIEEAGRGRVVVGGPMGTRKSLGAGLLSHGPLKGWASIYHLPLPGGLHGGEQLGMRWVAGPPGKNHPNSDQRDKGGRGKDGDTGRAVALDTRDHNHSNYGRGCLDMLAAT